MWPIATSCRRLFGKWVLPEPELLKLDEILLLVLRLSLSDIGDLYMDEYQFWLEAAEREIKRREKAFG